MILQTRAMRDRQCLRSSLCPWKDFWKCPATLMPNHFHTNQCQWKSHAMKSLCLLMLLESGCRFDKNWSWWRIDSAWLFQKGNHFYFFSICLMYFSVVQLKKRFSPLLWANLNPQGKFRNFFFFLYNRTWKCFQSGEM